MKSIFETFKKSVYNPVFYQGVASAPFSDAFRYYIKFSLFLSVVMTVVLGVYLVPQGVVFIKNRAPDLVKMYYPKELVVHIEKGNASANVPMPFFVSLQGATGATTTPDVMQNMLVIDTTEDFSKRKFDEYKTYALLTSTDIVTRSDSGQITIQSLRAAPTTTISQEVLLSWVEYVRSYLGYIVGAGIVMTFIAMIFGYLTYLIPLVLFALIPLIIAYLKKTPLSYVSAYKLSLYAIIPALALKALLNILGVFFLPPYFTLLVFMLVVAVNMREAKTPNLFENNN